MILIHAHPIEWIWLAMTIVDAWASLSSWLAAHRDWIRKRAERKALQDPIMRIKRASEFAVTYVIDVSSCLNAVLASLFLVLSIVSLFLAPPPPPLTTARQTLWLITGLIGASALNTIIAVYGRLARYRLSSGFYQREEATKLAGKSAAKAIADVYVPKVRIEPPDEPG